MAQKRRIVARFALAKSIAYNDFLEKESKLSRDSATGADISQVGTGFARRQKRGRTDFDLGTGHRISVLAVVTGP